VADLGEDLRLLKDKLAPKNVAAQRRREADRKHMLKDDDGRRRVGSQQMRHKGDQINFKVPAGTKKRVVDVSRALGISMVDVFLRGLEAVEREAKRK
jgi:hypothetical protein